MSCVCVCVSGVGGGWRESVCERVRGRERESGGVRV